jgi:hypothetical protein
LWGNKAPKERFRSFASSTGGNFVVQYYCSTTVEGFAMTEEKFETPKSLSDLPLIQGASVKESRLRTLMPSVLDRVF